MDIVLSKIKNMLSQLLDEKRFAHTFAVCEAAVVLAERFGEDKNKAYLAALLHDCARGLNGEQQINYCVENGIKLDDYMETEINPVHALISADMAKKKFKINDESILTAIKNHAVGYENMTLLDKIIFVADGIESNRKGSDVDEARNAALIDLCEAIIPVMRIKSYHLKGKPMHPNSNLMLKKIYEKKFNMPFEFLITKPKILLRDVKLSDDEQIFEAMTCPEVHSMHSDGFNNIADVRRYIPVLIQEYQNKNYRTLAIADRKTNKLCGTITIDKHKFIPRVELGYWISSPFRNRGYASEAVQAVIEHCLFTLNMKRVQAVHSIDNPASGRVLEKAGMMYEGTLRMYNGISNEKMYSAINFDESRE